MVQSRKEPTISSGDLAIGLEEEQRGKTKPSAQPNRSTAAPKASGNSGLTMFTLLLALLAAGAAGYTIWLNMQLSSSLLAATDRVAVLEQRLTLSDDEASQSVTALQANLKKTAKDVAFNESEIRKLWDTRNVNRRAITDNKNALDKVEASSSAQAKELMKRLDESEATVAAMAADLSKTNQLVSSQQQTLAKLQSASDDLAKLSSQLRGLSGLDTRVTSNEEAIEAIDAYRININRQLLEIQQRLAP